MLKRGGPGGHVMHVWMTSWSAVGSVRAATAVHQVSIGRDASRGRPQGGNTPGPVGAVESAMIGGRLRRRVDVRARAAAVTVGGRGPAHGRGAHRCCSKPGALNGGEGHVGIGIVDLGNEYLNHNATFPEV